MHRDERDLLEVLRFELEFLEKGGYGRSPREPWRPLLIFEGSPTCMNYDSQENPEPCEACVLMQLVPAEFRNAQIPCRHIPLNAEGEALDLLYRYGDQREIEEKYGKWLRSAITHLEEQRRTAPQDQDKPPGGSGEPAQGVPLYQNVHPKCANPSCPVAFHWLAGGRFFRFRPGDDLPRMNSVSATVAPPASTRRAKHYWLCEQCASIFTLAHKPGQGVLLQTRWPELPAPELKNEVSAT
jgi:hypothetical protein